MTNRDLARKIVNLAVAAAGTGVAAVLFPGRDDKQPAPAVELPDGSRAAAVAGSSMPSWLVGTLGAGVGALAVVGAEKKSTGAVVGSALTGAVTLLLREVRVVAGQRGLRIEGGVPGLGVSIPASQIRSARAVTVTAAEFGGWGIRWSPTRGVGVILRSGNALRLELERGELTVTVDDAATVAGVLNGVVGVRRGVGKIKVS